MGTLLRAVFVFLLVSLASAQVTCKRDDYKSLPPLPAFPTAMYTGKVGASSSYVQNHWSEVATLPRPQNTIVTTQTDCPHLGDNLLDWHSSATWGAAGVPQNGKDITIPENTKVLISSCSFPSTDVYGTITIPATSTLIIGDAPIHLQAKGMQVKGALLIGSPTCRLRNKVTLTMHGKRNAQSLPAPEYVKGIYVEGVIDVHGVEFFPTWTRLASTAKAGDKTIFMQDCPNWQPGQSVVVTTTELKDSRDWHRNDEAVIEKVEKTSIGTVCALTLVSPLAYDHYGGFEYQAEVALLSRNILIQGDPVNSDPTDTANVSCKHGTSPSTYPCEDSFLTGFGVHVMVAFTATIGRFSGVEVYRGGQTNVLGRYPLHFHMLGDLTAPNKFWISEASVHHSFFRCYTIHGTSGTTLENGVTITKSTGYNVIGHCFFSSEDGVEENHKITYNLAAHIHPLGPYWQASEGIVQGAFSTGSQSFGSQGTATVTSNPNLVLADDISASPFYFTNAYSHIEGNAASGGWAGFAFPNLPAPKGFFVDVKNFVPKNRPTLLFKGNSAHSTGFWQGHAAGVYLGGNLRVDSLTGNTIYTAGRFLPARDTCNDTTYGSALNTKGCPAESRVWLKFYDTKVFLANVGLQSWGDRSEIVRFEVHDVQISTNVFGQVWIDRMHVNCRTKNVPSYLSGCTNPTQWWTCNARDQAYFRGFIGFQFYDTGQTHMITNSKFTNCQSTMPSSQCINGKCSVKIFNYLTHSDQFTPGLMQLTRNISYVNVDSNFLTVPSTALSSQLTVSGRDANWMDEDGSVTPHFPGERVNIGSNWTGVDWWRYNNRCKSVQDNWVCPMSQGDSTASVNVRWDLEKEKGIGSVYCSNGPQGSAYLPCPAGARITHFGRSETNAFDVSVMPRVTGPIIASAGGWFIRYIGGTPAAISFTDIQVDHDDILHVAIPYPGDATLEVYMQAPTWCVPGVETWTPVCRHNLRPVDSVDKVRAAWGDAYFFDTKKQLLHLRIVAMDSLGYRFGTKKDYSPTWVWNSTTTSSTYFARGGVRLLVTGSSFWSLNVKATSANCQPKCPDLPLVGPPPATPLAIPPRCANAPVVTNAGFGTCAVNMASGATCKPECKPGFAGFVTASCNSGSWTITGSCVGGAVCPDPPTVANAGSGTCGSNTPNGNTCAPACLSGFTGTVSAKCNSGAWAVTGSCSAAVSDCPSPPTVANAGPGTCGSNTPNGNTCAPACLSGFTGTVSAKCNSGAWAVTGSCTSTACPTSPVITNGLAGNCGTNTPSGNTCTPVCASGFSGTLSAKCNSGAWAVTGSCTSTACPTSPVITNGLAGNCGTNTPSGNTCTPVCASGFSGTLSAKCNSGTWAVTGSCTSTSCPNPPVISNALAGNCGTNTPSGNTCAPVCQAGFTGTLSAKCNLGSWGITGSCTSTSCATLPTIANSGPGDCVANTATGSSCSPVCLSGYSGLLSATCNSGSWKTTGSCTATSCSVLPTIDNADSGDCAVNAASGTTCTPICRSGFTGKISASCNAAAWTVTGTCTSTACATLPSIPNSENGNCLSNVASGTKCTPVCLSGYAGTLSATCNLGAWSTTGSCVKTCASLPSNSNSEPGNCVANSAHGTKCTPVCKTGYTGALSASCVDGTWTATGTCTGLPCSGLPSIQDSLAGDCSPNSASGTKCTPVCKTRFSGTLSATCTLGTWSTTGACAAVGGQPCASLPSIPDASIGNCAANTASGTTCTPTCNSGFSGTLSATCDNAAWTTTGTCKNTACATLPPALANAKPGDCAANVASGTKCTPVCDSGFAGTLSATCTDTTWSVTGTCASTACASLPVIPDALPGDCVTNTPSGSKCTPVCQSGFTGSLTAACTDTLWSTSGKCTSTSCASLPVFENAEAGDCKTNAESGSTCTPVCKAGFSGTLSATCTNSGWTNAGSCSPLPCSGLPTVANAAPGDCTADAVSGSTCTPVCSDGFTGTPKASCEAGVWSVTGVCANSAGPSCPTRPTVPFANSGSCPVDAPSGTTCTPTCSAGYSGDVLATCASGTWSVSGACVGLFCGDFPNLGIATPGDCISGAASGSTCTPKCNEGFDGTLSASCNKGEWSTQGTCLSSGCVSVPSIPNAQKGDCAFDSPGGATCTPQCNEGFLGTLSATCHSGTWSVSGSCTAASPCASLPVFAHANNPGSCVVRQTSGSSCSPICDKGFNGNPVATCVNGVWKTEGQCRRAGRRWHVTATVDLEMSCEDVSGPLLEDLNKYLKKYYEEKDSELSMEVTKCQEEGDRKRQAQSSVVLEGDMTGSGAPVEAPEAPETVEAFFQQLQVPYSSLQVSIVEEGGEEAEEENTDGGLPAGAIAGIVIGVVIIVVLLAAILFMLYQRQDDKFERV